MEIEGAVAGGHHRAGDPEADTAATRRGRDIPPPRTPPSPPRSTRLEPYGEDHRQQLERELSPCCATMMGLHTAGTSMRTLTWITDSSLVVQ